MDEDLENYQDYENSLPKSKQLQISTVVNNYSGDWIYKCFCTRTNN